MLNYASHEVGAAHVVKLSGSLDALSVPEIRPQVETMLAHNPSRVVIDLSAVDTVDSTGVALVVSIFKRVRALGGAVRIAGVGGQPREIFHFLKIDQSIPVAPTVDAALAAF